jgi:hypothetical protein
MEAMDFVRFSAPDRVSLEWTEPVSLEAALQDALRAAQECTAFCLEIVPLLPQDLRGRIGTVCAASSLAAERLEEESDETIATLSLCIRIIDSSLSALGDRRLPHGFAVSAGRCADRCRRALAALCLCEEEGV